MYNLKSIIDRIVSSNPKIKEKIIEQKIKSNWNILFGKVFDNKINKFIVVNNTLEITLSSSNLRNDLFMKKEKLITELNKGLYLEERIKDIVFF